MISTAESFTNNFYEKGGIELTGHDSASMELAQQIGQTHGELHRYGSLYKVYSCWQWTTLKVK